MAAANRPVSRVGMGSAPLTQALIDKVQALFPKATLSNSYGTTEAGPCPFGPHPDGVPRPPLCAGYPLPHSEVELRGGASPDEGEVFFDGRTDLTKLKRGLILMVGQRNRLLPAGISDSLRR